MIFQILVIMRAIVEILWPYDDNISSRKNTYWTLFLNSAIVRFFQCTWLFTGKGIPFLMPQILIHHMGLVQTQLGQHHTVLGSPLSKSPEKIYVSCRKRRCWLGDQIWSTVWLLHPRWKVRAAWALYSKFHLIAYLLIA